jgi:predicted Zn-dependent protease
METKVKSAVAIPDAEYSQLRIHAKTNGKRGYMCWDKKGERHRFYMKGQDLYGEHKVGEALEEYEVMSMTEALQKQKEMEGRNPFKEQTKAKMRKDFPDMSEEDLDMNVDIINEANESIKRLISSGVDPKAAYQVIVGALHSDETNNLVIKELQEKAKEGPKVVELSD